MRKVEQKEQQPLQIEDISGGADVALLGIEMVHSPLNSSGKQFSNLGDNKVRPVRGDGDENDINGTHAASALVEYNTPASHQDSR